MVHSHLLGCCFTFAFPLLSVSVVTFKFNCTVFLLSLLAMKKLFFYDEAVGVLNPRNSPLKTKQE